MIAPSQIKSSQTPITRIVELMVDMQRVHLSANLQNRAFNRFLIRLFIRNYDLFCVVIVTTCFFLCHTVCHPFDTPTIFLRKVVNLCI